MLSGRVIAVRLKRPASRSDLAMKPPLLPPAYERMLVAVQWWFGCVVTYANDGNVLDVIVGRHDVGGLLSSLERLLQGNLYVVFW